MQLRAKDSGYPCGDSDHGGRYLRMPGMEAASSGVDKRRGVRWSEGLDLQSPNNDSKDYKLEKPFPCAMSCAKCFPYVASGDYHGDAEKVVYKLEADILQERDTGRLTCSESHSKYEREMGFKSRV